MYLHFHWFALVPPDNDIISQIIRLVNTFSKYVIVNSGKFFVVDNRADFFYIFPL